MFLLNGAIPGSWAPQTPLLLPRHGIAEFILGLLILGMGVGSMAAMCLSGRLTARHGSRALVRRTALACAAVLAPSITTLALAIAALGASIAMMDVATNANAVGLEQASGRAILSSTHGFWSVGGLLGGANPGAAIAAVSFIGCSGMFIAPPLIGLTADCVGFPAIFVALAGLLLIIAALSPPLVASRRPGFRKLAPAKQRA